MLALAAVETSEGRDLRDKLNEAIPHQTGPLKSAIAPLASAIGAQIANQLPTLATSASFTYEFNPATDTFVRTALTYGPLFSERAATIGRNKLDVNLSYGFLKFDRFNGHDLDHLASRIAIGKDANGAPQFAGVRRTSLSPQFPDLDVDKIYARAVLDLDLEAQLVALSFTYGLTDKLDVNVELPIIRTFMRRTISEQTLDPRYEALISVDPARPTIGERYSNRDSAVGLGDVHLRGKQLVAVTPVRLAGLLDLALPTGSPGDFHGTGHTRLGTFLIVSHVLYEILEPHVQVGVEFNVDDVDKSQAKYLAGVTVQVFERAALTVDFLGRSEFAPLSRIPNSARLPAVQDGTFEQGQVFHGRPYLVDIQRNDILEASLGIKVRAWRGNLVFANVILPLNDDGLRANVVPVVGVERSF